MTQLNILSFIALLFFVVFGLICVLFSKMGYGVKKIWYLKGMEQNSLSLFTKSGKSNVKDKSNLFNVGLISIFFGVFVFIILSLVHF
jgi:hypothetical protein